MGLRGEEDEMKCGLCAQFGDDDTVEAIPSTEDVTNSKGADDFEESGLMRPTTLPSPYTPSKQERMEHEPTHVPYRSWCPHCVMAKAMALGHDSKKTDSDNDRQLAGRVRLCLLKQKAMALAAKL